MTEEEQLEQSRRRILALRSDLYRYFVGKNEIIDLMTIAAIAQEPLLLVGQPGTAKSDSTGSRPAATAAAAGKSSR